MISEAEVAQHEERVAELKSQIAETAARIARALEILFLFLVYLVSLVILSIVSLLPFILKCVSVGAWIVMSLVSGWAAWTLFETVSPGATWSNILLGVTASVVIAFIPFDATFTEKMWGRCAAAAVIGVGIWQIAIHLIEHPDWFFYVRLIPNALSVSLVVLLTIQAKRKGDEHGRLELDD